MPTLTGLDVLGRDGCKRLLGHRVALLCNQASITKDIRHAIDLFQEAGVGLVAVFGPQHGLFGHTQDNMIEWRGEGSVGGVRVHSLYGEHRQPTDETLDGVELFVVDLQDVGARYYTFIWTMALCMQVCERRGLPMLVLDRPNPIGGDQVEGPVMEAAWSSFVGLHALPARHGMTIAEIARHLQESYYPKLPLETVPLEGWRRSAYFDDLDLPWVSPSPNMPTVDTAIVYPGMCLLEGTNLSEGRGTTRPFETFGAPWLQGSRMSESLNGLLLPGVFFRPVEFEPTFQKHAGQVCGGCFIHVLDRHAFEPVITAIAAIRECHHAASEKFAWRDPPYEYEYKRRPVDLLTGNGWLAEAAISDQPLAEIRKRLALEAAQFEPQRRSALLY